MNDLELDCPFDNEDQDAISKSLLNAEMYLPDNPNLTEFSDLVWSDFGNPDIPEKKEKNKAKDYNALYGKLRLKFYLASLLS